MLWFLAGVPVPRPEVLTLRPGVPALRVGVVLRVGAVVFAPRPVLRPPLTVVRLLLRISLPLLVVVLGVTLSWVVGRGLPVLSVFGRRSPRPGLLSMRLLCPLSGAVTTCRLSLLMPPFHFGLRLW